MATEIFAAETPRMTVQIRALRESHIELHDTKGRNFSTVKGPVTLTVWPFIGPVTWSHSFISLIHIGRPMLEVEELGTLAKRFSDMADLCSRFSTELIRDLPMASGMRRAEHERQNLTVVRTMFAKWSLEILSILYTSRQLAFQDIRKELGISSNVLSSKLAQMGRLGLTSRKIVDGRPPRVHYSLTGKGRQVVKLGEPVLLYLRCTEGLLDVGLPHVSDLEPLEYSGMVGGRGSAESGRNPKILAASIHSGRRAHKRSH